MIYLDHAASSPISERVLNVLCESQRVDFANPSSSHKIGRKLSERIEFCRRSILEITKGTGAFDFIFTSSATESNNTIIRGLRLKDGDKILLSAADHPSVINPAENLKRYGCSVDLLPLGSGGIIHMDELSTRDISKVKLVIVTYVNNQSGIVNNINSISKKIKSISPDIHIHVDAVQGFGKLPVSLNDWNVDSVSVSSHKIGGPKGIAGLFLRKEVSPEPLMFGGGQESGMRSSTIAAPLVFGFFEAIKNVMEDQDSDLKSSYILSRKLRSEIMKKIDKVIFPFAESNSSPYIQTFILPGIPADMIVRHLEEKEIYISTSSACTSKLKKRNDSFSAMLIAEKYHGSVLRVSFSRSTTERDIDIFIDKLFEIYLDLKNIILND